MKQLAVRGAVEVEWCGQRARGGGGKFEFKASRREEQPFPIAVVFSRR